MESIRIQTENHIEELKSGASNMLVAVRVRPLNSREKQVSQLKTVKILDDSLVILIDPGDVLHPEDIFRKNRSKEQKYAFDFAFPETASQQQVYEKTGKFLVEGLLSGYSATIFAYGATGCGKTFTILGSATEQGIMQRATGQLFAQVGAGPGTFRVKASFLQIYNEVVRDLLSQDERLDVREDPKLGVVVAGASQHFVENREQLFQLIRSGTRNRTVEATGCNQASSRSHAILELTVESNETGNLHQAKFTLVDLAGSQRAAQTTNSGLRMLEGAKINRSLLVLGNCIVGLSDLSKGKRVSHIPYRGSKLTRLLKDSLGGACRTVMIANVSPAVLFFEDTYNTLNYAHRAKSIKTSISRTVLDAETHLQSYVHLINQLKQENEALRRQLQTKQGQPAVVELPTLVDHEEEILTTADARLRKIEERAKKDLQAEYAQRGERFQEDQRRKIEGIREVEGLIKSLKRQYNRNYLKCRLREVQLQIERHEMILREKHMIKAGERKERIILELRRQLEQQRYSKNDNASRMRSAQGDAQKHIQASKHIVLKPLQTQESDRSRAQSIRSRRS